MFSLKKLTLGKLTNDNSVQCVETSGQFQSISRGSTLNTTKNFSLHRNKFFHKTIKKSLKIT